MNASDFKFVNHGAGIMSLEQHAHLIKIGAMVCKDGVDYARSDYPKLMINKKDDWESVDMGGDLRQITLEIEAQQTKQVKCRVEYFPRAWEEYWTNYKAKKDAEQLEKEALDNLAK